MPHLPKKPRYNTVLMQTSVPESDEIVIDLAKYLRPLSKYWRLLAGFIVIGAALGLALSFISPASYEAVASVAIVNTRTEVQFDPRIRTLLPDDGSTTVNEARRNALIGLVLSTEIAQKAVEQFRDRLPLAERDPSRLILRVKGDSVIRGDLIQIKVQMTDADLAADIATFWAREYETIANAIYAGSSAEYVSAIRSELDRSREQVNGAQGELNAFLKSSKQDELRLTIANRSRQIDSLEARKLAGTRSEMERAQSALADVRTLSEAQSRARQLRILAAAMRDHVRSGGDAVATTNALPLMQLKLQAYAVTAGGQRATGDDAAVQTTSDAQRPDSAKEQPKTVIQIPSLSQSSALQVQVVAPSVVISAEQQLRDLEALIGSLDKIDSELGVAVRTASATSGVALTTPEDSGPLDVAMAQALSELRDARAALEDQDSTLKRLTTTRDLAVNTFNSLSNKLAEVEVSNAVINREVSLANMAIAPATRTVSRAVPVVAGGAIGLLLGLLTAIVLAARSGAFSSAAKAD